MATYDNFEKSDRVREHMYHISLHYITMLLHLPSNVLLCAGRCCSKYALLQLLGSISIYDVERICPATLCSVSS